MRATTVGFITAILSVAVCAAGLAQELSESQKYTELLGPHYGKWNVAFGKLTGVDGEYRYIYLEPGLGIAYPNPEDGFILKRRPEANTQYCILMGVRKGK